MTYSALSTLPDITIPTGSTNGNGDWDVQITLIPVTNPQTNQILYGTYSVTATAIRKGELAHHGQRESREHDNEHYIAVRVRNG